MTPPQHATERTRRTGSTVDATRTSEEVDHSGQAAGQDTAITDAISGSSTDADDATTTGSEGSSQGTVLSKDGTFHILQNKRRRRVLQYLAETEGPVPMSDIAEQIAAVEHETTVHQLTSTQRQRVYIALYQSHLPKLTDFGLITYNQSRGSVERTRAADQVMRYLDQDEGADRSRTAENEWMSYYAGVTILSILLIGAVGAGFGPISLLSDIGLTAVITLCYAAVTISMAVNTSRERLTSPPPRQ